jgi:transposase
MSDVVTIGIDLTKSVFAVHGVDADGAVVIRKMLRRAQMLPFFEKLPPCLIGMECCPSAHHWGRQLRALGHDVKLMPAHYVAAYVKRNKNDANDAEGICEAVTRPSMRFVGIKDEERQGILTQHRARQMIMRQRVQTSNVIRSLMAEYGIIARVGRRGIDELCEVVRDEQDQRLPASSRDALLLLVGQLDVLKSQLLAFDNLVLRSVRETELGRRLTEIPGVGPVLASAVMACVPDASVFKSGRDLAAWIGLVPRQNSSGSKTRVGGISKAGDSYLRTLLIQGALAVMRHLKRGSDTHRWLRGLAERKPYRVAAVAMANKTARIIWAIMTSGEHYRYPVAVAA